MPYRKETFRAPGICEIRKYFSYRAGGPRKRGPNEKPADEKMRKRNSRRSRENLYRIIATNFKRDDIRIDLTYENPEPTPEEAKRRIQKFLRQLRGAYRKKGQELKYVYATECKGHRIHHHLIINAGLTRSEIQACWPWAKFNYRSFRLYDGTPEDAKRLSWYITKETDETIQEDEAVQKWRWVPSRNLKKPDVRTETIKAKHWAEKPKAPKGYQVAEVRNGWNAEGYPFQYVKLVPLDESDVVWPVKNRKKLAKKRRTR